MLTQPTQLRGALLTSAVCLIWVGLAVRSPSLTYHFAPLIAGVLWPLSLRSDGRRSTRDAWTAGAAAAALVSVTSIGLHLVDKLEGPTFWNEGPPLTEAVIFAVIAAAFGARSASRKRAGLLGTLVQQGD
jgi:hypothetical protein